MSSTKWSTGRPRTSRSRSTRSRRRCCRRWTTTSARATSEFDTLAELRADIEGRLQEQIDAEIDSGFRAATADTLVHASGVQPSGPLVDARANELLGGFLRTLEQRGISPETYLAASGQTPEQLRDQLRAEAALSVARELVLDAVADDLGIEVSDEEIESALRDQGETDETVTEVMGSPLRDQIREDLRLRAALDRVAAEVKPIPVELAAARDKLWTPGQEKAPQETTLWTPGSKET